VNPHPQPPRVTLIVAMAKNRAIGKDNTLPWHIPEDLKRFKALTMGHPIVMGRKTFDSIGRPLPGRRNIVISRNRSLAIPGVEVTGSLDEALAACSAEPEVFVIGGEQIYAQALGRADRIEMTEVGQAVDGDAFFPPIDEAAWVESSSTTPAPPAGSPAYRFRTLDRRR
jgi:dihydrofolate reductase